MFLLEKELGDFESSLFLSFAYFFLNYAHNNINAYVAWGGILKI